MPREGAEAKARRYLSEGRLTVTRVWGDDVRAVVRGSGEFYRPRHDPNGAGWSCDCPARGTCCHLHALMLVCVRTGGVE